MVLYRGSVPCDVLLIGEAPGNVEDALGKPFVGPSGKLLDDILKQALPPDLSYAITNVVACIPRDTSQPLEQEKFRQPTKDEIDACKPRLLEFIDIAKPKAIILIGKIANKTKHVASLKLPTLAIVHPAYMLRNGGTKSVDYKRTILTIKQWTKSNV